ncbi:MAG: 2Fe-2S iron-sulfur cluster-binding protein, partial [Bacteroidota bacterium]
PEAMVFLIEKYLMKNGVDKSKIHYELFGTGAGSVSKKPSIKKTGKTCSVTLIEGGKNMNFELEQGGNNILDAALNNAADLPYACKGGVCSTCKAKLLEGEVEMPVSYGLEPDELEAGFILTCQSFPKTAKVVVDFDV